MTQLEKHDCCTKCFWIAMQQNWFQIVIVPSSERRSLVNQKVFWSHMNGETDTNMSLHNCFHFYWQFTYGFHSIECAKIWLVKHRNILNTALVWNLIRFNLILTLAPTCLCPSPSISSVLRLLSASPVCSLQQMMPRRLLSCEDLLRHRRSLLAWDARRIEQGWKEAHFLAWPLCMNCNFSVTPFFSCPPNVLYTHPGQPGLFFHPFCISHWFSGIDESNHTLKPGGPPPIPKSPSKVDAHLLFATIIK